ncbi:MAG: redoxin domain-containing protein [bacterium JZ-2024 1]
MKATPPGKPPKIFPVLALFSVWMVSYFLLRAVQGDLLTRAEIRVPESPEEMRAGGESLPSAPPPVPFVADTEARPVFSSVFLVSASMVNLQLPPAPTPPPEFSLRFLDGSQKKLGDYRGKVVILNFWASWCPECVKEFPSMQKMWEKWEKEGLVLVGINWKEPPRKAELEAQKNHLTFPIALDEEGAVGTLFGVKGVPESYFFSKEGLYLGRIWGPLDWTSVEAEHFIRHLVRGQPVYLGKGGEVSFLTSDTLRDWLKEDKRMMMLDIRDHQEYQKGHIPGSLSFPHQMLIQNVVLIPYDLPVVIIDSTENRAAMVGNFLVKLGHPQIMVLKGGLSSWKEPLETGEGENP